MMIVPRGWKIADAVRAARDFLSQPPPRRAAIRDLMKELLSPNPFARRCAADLARRISAREPGILRKYAPILIDHVTDLPLQEWPARSYVLLAAALNAATHEQRMRLAPPVRALTQDGRIALRAIALEAFAILAVAEPDLRDEAVLMLERNRHDESAAMRSRARRMLLVLLASETTSRP
jgi:hypothetical protein